MTASSTLAILLLLGVIIEVFATFSNSASGGPAFSSPSGFSAVFSSASTVYISTLADLVAETFGTATDSLALRMAGAACSASTVEDAPSSNFGTMAVSMYLGRCVKTLIFLPFGTAEMAEVAVFLFFPFFREG
jgi:hypothetical protein